MIASPEVLIDRALERAGGPVDFGPTGWEHGLERLVAAIATDVGDEPDAVARLEEIIVGRLVVRLRVEDWHGGERGSTGDADEPPVEGPLVIVGLPRTATTALHYLLAVDPQFRYLRSWEAKDPVPPPDLETEADDPRRAQQGGQANVRHIATVDGPAEDGPIHSFHFHHGEIVLPVPSYTEWWRGADHATAFAYHERILRMLHSSRPPHRWLLKFPNYLFHLPQFVAQYPRARFVVTHRDPVEALPSACSTIADSRAQRLPDLRPDPTAFGHEILEHFAEGMRRAMADRVLLGEQAFLDVGQPDIESDPIGTADRIYDFAGLDLDETVRRAMGDWAASNRRGSRGTHHYSAEQYGLDGDRIETAFSEYVEAYGWLYRKPGSLTR